MTSQNIINRRIVLGGSLTGFFAYAMRNRSDLLFAKQPKGRAKRCLVLWMNGGPSQIETFDPKPRTSTGGEVGAIKSSIPGLAISELLPAMSQRMHHFSVLRCLSSKEGEHLRGQYNLHTGYPLVPGFPRPSLGSVVSQQTASLEFPGNVTIGPRGFGPAYMGPEHAPFIIEQPDEALDLLVNIQKRRSRLELLRELGRDFGQQHVSDALNRRQASLTQIESLVTTPFIDALKLRRETRSVHNRYGDHAFGQACLLGRRLLEIGVTFVEIQHDGWDTHQNNSSEVRELCQAIDGSWSALIDDLHTRGMLDDTIIVWMGEFGRTPRINAKRGRDHYPQVTPVVIGGGPIARGAVVGKTNRLGTQVEDEAVSVADLFATVFAALGIDPEREFQTSFGSPAAATDGGTPIGQLLTS